MRSKAPKLPRLKRSLIHVSYQHIHLCGSNQPHSIHLPLPVLEVDKAQIETAIEELFDRAPVDTVLDLVLSDPLVPSGQMFLPQTHRKLGSQAAQHKAQQFLNWKFEQELGLDPATYELNLESGKSLHKSTLLSVFKHKQNRSETAISIQAINKQMLAHLVSTLTDRRHLIASCGSVSDFVQAFVPKAANRNSQCQVFLFGDAFTITSSADPNGLSFWREPLAQGSTRNQLQSIDLIAETLTSHKTGKTQVPQVYGLNEQGFVSKLETALMTECEYHDIGAFGLFAQNLEPELERAENMISEAAHA